MTVDLMSGNVNTIERIMERLIRIEYGTVVQYDKFGRCGVQDRDDPLHPYWNTVTVKVRQVKRNPPYYKGPMRVMHHYCLVLQDYSQKWAGKPYLPRIGDMVAILFILNQKPIILGTVVTNTQDPVCRAPFDIRRWDKIDARYDYVEKWCQWRPPKFNDDQEVVEHLPGKYPICYKRFHKNRDQIHVTECIEGSEDPCNRCRFLDYIKRTGNQWEKIYSSDTDSEDPEHPYIPVWGTRLSKRRHEWHEPCGSYFVFQNNGEDPDYGRGLIRLANAVNENAQCAHINMDPRGTVDIHTQHERRPYSREHEGTRMSIVARDDNTVDHSFEAIDFVTGSLIEILKNGNININSLNNSSYIQVRGTDNTIYEHGTRSIKEEADVDITQITGTVDQQVDLVHNHGDQVIDGTCTHGTCSCSSDIRLKKDVKSITVGLNEVQKLRPVSFKWRYRDDGTHYGLVPQEACTVLPDIVSVGRDNMMSIRYEELVAVLIKSVQELSEKIKELEERLG